MKISIIKKIKLMALKALGLYVKENNTITDNNEIINYPQTCNNKPILVDYDSTKSILKDYILLKLNGNFLSSTYFFFNKHIHIALESKINFLFEKLIGFVLTPELHNKSKSKNLNDLLIKLSKNNYFEINDTANVSLSNKWKELYKVFSKQPFRNNLLKLDIKFSFVKLEGESEIKACRIPNINKDTDYIYTQSYIDTLFPIYKLLNEAGY